MRKNVLIFKIFSENFDLVRIFKKSYAGQMIFQIISKKFRKKD